MERFEFRAWDKKTKQMYSVGVIDFANKKVQIAIVDKHGNCYVEYWRTFDEIILMQYTGLTDKNGTKIFEGDVIQTAYCDRTYRGEIYWTEDGYKITDESLEHWYWSDIEVIGNIHDNKELEVK